MSATILESAPRAASSAAAPSTATRRAGRILTGVAALFLTFDAAMKFVASPEAVEGTLQLGWQAHHLPIIGVLAAACLVLYVAAVLWGGLYLRDARVRALLRPAR